MRWWRARARGIAEHYLESVGKAWWCLETPFEFCSWVSVTDSEGGGASQVPALRQMLLLELRATPKRATVALRQFVLREAYNLNRLV